MRGLLSEMRLVFKNYRKEPAFQNQVNQGRTSLVTVSEWAAAGGGWTIWSGGWV